MAAHNNIITIDLSIWCTMADKARIERLSESAIRQRVFRTKQGKGKIRVEYLDIPELGLTLVKRD